MVRSRATEKTLCVEKTRAQKGMTSRSETINKEVSEPHRVHRKPIISHLFSSLF